MERNRNDDRRGIEKRDKRRTGMKAGRELRGEIIEIGRECACHSPQSIESTTVALYSVPPLSPDKIPPGGAL